MVEEVQQKPPEKEEITNSVVLKALHLFFEKAKSIDGATEETIEKLKSLFENQPPDRPEDALDLLLASRAIHVAERESDKDQRD
jgi:hypothetical protein